MKLLLTGKNGQLGFELQRALAPLGEVIAVGHAECDVGDPAILRQLLSRVQPDVIINAAAYTAVDKAETDVGTAFAVNAVAPRVLGEEAARRGALVVHFSTDYVFDGCKVGAYVEEDAPNPKSTYGQSKLAGELALAQATPRHLILRTSWVLGAHGGNFVKTMLRLARERDRLTVVADQVGAPTSAALLADITALLIQRHHLTVNNDFAYGTYHVVAAGETTWYDYARFVIAEAIAAGQPLKVTPDLVSPLTTEEYPTAATRPANSRLNTERFRNSFALRLPHWQEGVRHILHQLF